MARGIKTGGRKAGVPNKYPNQFKADLRSICIEAGCSPFEALIKLAMDPEHDHHFNAVKEACRYLYPTLSSVTQTVTADVKQNHAVDQDLVALLIKANGRDS